MEKGRKESLVKNQLKLILIWLRGRSTAAAAAVEAEEREALAKSIPINLAFYFQ